ncbi:MAG: 1-deoxy-D-xylulose-5-phosphate synthase [bacterium]|nr:1-deoxy-D-xylulose-5-phosphate synthase [bacterium]
MNRSSKKYSHIDTPEALRTLSIGELKELAEELREELIEVITQNGGHLAPSLGVIELTIALHKVFDTPRDKIIWDVGHQAYVHKMLTGRRTKLHTIRQFGGISGFLKRSESEYDVFGAGHASTSISAAYGIACARDLLGETYRVCAVIGDGAMTGGLAYEALNNAGSSGKDLLVILNDNKMSISPNVGAISKYLVNIITDPRYRKTKDEIWELTERLPGKDTIRHVARRIEEGVKALVSPGMLFEDLGFQYIGPIDGHHLDDLIPILERVRNFRGPVLLHVMTVKGKGWDIAEADPVKFHGVKAGTPSKNGSANALPPKIETTKTGVLPTYTDAFGEIVLQLAKENQKLIAITAAMCDGTGLSKFAEQFPNRFFDVGIAEGHAVCFAAGLATQGLRPICAIYSTFLQRAYDQIVHDVAIQHLPVIFALDRAGLVGEDGPTHHGALDLSYLTCIQEMVVACPKDGNELRDLLVTALDQTTHPFAIRYPKESCVAFTKEQTGRVLPIGSWEILIPAKQVMVLATGAMVSRAQQVVRQLQNEGYDIGLVNARFVKPIDEALLLQITKESSKLIIIEENSPIGGLGTMVTRAMNQHHRSLPTMFMALPDRFVEHGARESLLELVSLSSNSIEKRIREFCSFESRGE